MPWKEGIGKRKRRKVGGGGGDGPTSKLNVAIPIDFTCLLHLIKGTHKNEVALLDTCILIEENEMRPSYA